MSEVKEMQPALTLPSGTRVVVIVAHHDDIEFGIAGSIAQWVRDGAEVTYVIITDGGAGSNDVGVVREELVARRKREQLEAAKCIGVNDVRFLGYLDGELEPTIALRHELTRILREVKPYRVVCQDPETIFFRDTYINHPDHRAAGTAAIYATFPSSESRPIFASLLDEGYEPHKVSELYMTLSLRPTHYQDITATIDDKMATLRCHESQIGTGDDAENGALKWIRERNHESGDHVGVAYAEFFRVMKFDQPPETTDEDVSS